VRGYGSSFDLTRSFPGGSLPAPGQQYGPHSVQRYNPSGEPTQNSMSVQPVPYQSHVGGALIGNGFGIDSAMSRSAAGWSTAPGQYHDDPRTFDPHNPAVGHNPNFQPIQPLYSSHTAAAAHPRMWQAPALPAPPPSGSFPQMTVPPESQLHPILLYSAWQGAPTARALQHSSRSRAHVCEPATRPGTDHLTIVSKYGQEDKNFDVRASTNSTFVTVGQCLAIIDFYFLGLERPCEGNDPYNSAGAESGGQRAEEMCLCLSSQTSIDYYRWRYGKAGLKESEDGPNTFEWKVRGLPVGDGLYWYAGLV